MAHPLTFGYGAMPTERSRFPPEVFALRIHSADRIDRALGIVRVEWSSVRCGVRGYLDLRPEWMAYPDALRRLSRFIERMVGGQLMVMADTMVEPLPAARQMVPHWEREIHAEMERIEPRWDGERASDRYAWVNHTPGYVRMPGFEALRMTIDDYRRHSPQPETNEQRKARDKAKALLLANLNEEQRASFAKDNRFSVLAKDGKTYTITNERSFNVQGPDGKRYCGQLVDTPVEDQMLAQKLLLEHDPEKFFKNANVSGGSNPFDPFTLDTVRRQIEEQTDRLIYQAITGRATRE